LWHQRATVADLSALSRNYQRSLGCNASVFVWNPTEEPAILVADDSYGYGDQNDRQPSRAKDHAADTHLRRRRATKRDAVRAQRKLANVAMIARPGGK
jgi:hypothetical protein